MTLRRFAFGLLAATALTSPAVADPLGDIFVIDMENHNFTQPAGQTSPGQILGNAAASFQNSLIDPTNPNSAMVSYATNYTNVHNPGQPNDHIHPSEPNYLWQEAGKNFGILNDSSVATNSPIVGNATNLSGLLQQKGISWTSYQEDTQLATTGGLNATAGNGTNGGINGIGGTTNSNVTSNLVDPSKNTVPLVSLSGTSANYTNSYNGTHQFDFGTKHDGQLFFDATNGITNHSVNGGVTSNAGGTGSQDLGNKEISHYKGLTKSSFQQDLNNNTVSRYNLITPDQFNDSHTALSGGFTYKGTHFTGDQAAIAQGDNFLSQIIPQIMGSQAFKNNGAIVIWWDETEGQNPTFPNPDDNQHTLEEIVISPLAKGNAYHNSIPYTHSSDLLTLEEIFQTGQCLGDSCTPGTNDLSDLFVPGTIPDSVPEPASALLLLPALAGLGMLRRRYA